MVFLVIIFIALPFSMPKNFAFMISLVGLSSPLCNFYVNFGVGFVLFLYNKGLKIKDFLSPPNDKSQ